MSDPVTFETFEVEVYLPEVDVAIVEPAVAAVAVAGPTGALQNVILDVRQVLAAADPRETPPE